MSFNFAVNTERKYISVVDFHSHILPEIDDGAETPEISAAMLAESYNQGVEKIVATPHFYPGRDTPQRFLARREKAIEKLQEIYDPIRSPAVYAGAEVAFFTGLSRSEAMTELCVVGTRYMLIEMPASRWSDKTVEEILSIENNLSIKPIVAHIERYIFLQEKGTLEHLVNSGVLIQSNADFFCAFRSRRKAIRMLEQEKIHLIGSDCHNMTTRAPNMAKADESISSRLNPFCMERIIGISEKVLERARPILKSVVSDK